MKREDDFREKAVALAKLAKNLMEEISLLLEATEADACMRWEWIETTLGAKSATMPWSAMEDFSSSVLMRPPLCLR